MSIIKKITSTHHMGAGPVFIRLFIGLIFMAHGAQKLFGWFDGPGLEGTTQMMVNLGVEPASIMALACASAEFFGGLLLLVGFLTRIASLALIVNMLVAVFAVHLSRGFFISNGGYEFALLLLICALAYLISGAGRFSFDYSISQYCLSRWR
ncbi:MAG: DoxX family protein [Gammaproteobacteria bacterium]